MACEHEFIGDKAGVLCRRCGLRMTAEAYRRARHPPAPPKTEDRGAPPGKTPGPKKRG